MQDRTEKSGKAVPRDSLAKFQTLLRPLFQFDAADLNFGIHKILNYRWAQVEEFVTNRLPQIVED
jgi:adenine-specific DNA-methyltransferase